MKLAEEVAALSLCERVPLLLQPQVSPFWGYISDWRFKLDGYQSTRIHITDKTDDFNWLDVLLDIGLVPDKLAQVYLLEKLF